MRTTRAALAALLLLAGGGAIWTGAAEAVATDPCAEPTILGTPDDDELRGTDGPDVIRGGGGDDRLLGLGGDDILCGGGGQDVLRGGDGVDSLYGGRDAKVAEDTDYYVYFGDTLDGGPGDDLLDPGPDSRHEGSVDRLTYAHSATGVMVDLPAGIATGDGTDTIASPVGSVLGSSYDDDITGTGLSEILTGSGGRDRVDGGGGDDVVAGGAWDGGTNDLVGNVLLGGAGRDTLDGSSGDDILRGNGGPDLVQGNRGLDRSHGGSGRDRFSDAVIPGDGQVIDGGPGAHDSLGDLSFFDSRHRYQRHIRGTIDLPHETTVAHFGDVTITIATPGIEDVSAPRGDLWRVVGTSGANTLSAGFFGSPVRIHAGAGRDSLFGSAKADVLDGGPGRDRGDGYGGRDRIISIETLS